MFTVDPQHTNMSSSYRSNRLGLSHWDPYTVRRGGCLELYYCNMVEWFWWDSSLILTTSWFPSVLWHCWFGHLASKNRPRNDLLCVEWDVKPYKLTHSGLTLHQLHGRILWQQIAHGRRHSIGLCCMNLPALNSFSVRSIRDLLHISKRNK